jgi:hypothetical protein
MLQYDFGNRRVARRNKFCRTLPGIVSYFESEPETIRMGNELENNEDSNSFKKKVDQRNHQVGFQFERLST